MKRIRIDRRTFLRGMAGTAIALPCLEIMDEAQAHGVGLPSRFVYFQAIGTSIGHDSGAHFVPSMTGAGYDLPSALSPLGAMGHDVQADVSVVSGLSIPWVHWDDTPSTPASRSSSFHPGIVAPIVSGTSSHSSGSYVNGDGEEIGGSSDPQGPTAEWAVGNAIGDDTVFRALVYGLEGGQTGRSQRDTGEEESIQRNAQQAYLNLIGEATSVEPGGNEDPELAARRDLLFRRRLSALDLAADDSQRLAEKLGTKDKRRMERYQTELRELEEQLQKLREFEPSEACEPIDDPGGDPATSTGRVRLFNRLIRMAFSCDLSRSAMVLVGRTQSNVQMGPEIGIDGMMHELTHFNGTGHPQANMEAMIEWSVDLFGDLVANLKEGADGAGGSILDNTAAVFVPAGGWGNDGSEGRDTAHSTNDIAMLVAGRAGGLTPGQHIRQPGVHPTLVTTTAMDAVGAGDSLGDIQGRIGALFE